LPETLLQRCSVILAGMWRLRASLAIALCGCASYRVLPSAAPATGLSPLPVRYEETRLGLFRSVKDDGAFERVFVDPRNPAHLVATLVRPEAAAVVSSDGGASWTRASIPFDVPDADERGSQRPPERAPGAGAGPPMGPGMRGDRSGRRGRRGAAPEAMRASPRAPPAEETLAYLDPLRLLARFNSGLALTGIARAGAELHAWAPTRTHWERLADAALAACDAEGEISLGPGVTPAGPGAFMLLRSTDGGASWTEVEQAPDAFGAAGQLRAQRIAPYPAWLAAGEREMFIGFAARDRKGLVWRETWRDSF